MRRQAVRRLITERLAEVVVRPPPATADHTVTNPLSPTDQLVVGHSGASATVWFMEGKQFHH